MTRPRIVAATTFVLVVLVAVVGWRPTTPAAVPEPVSGAGRIRVVMLDAISIRDLGTGRLPHLDAALERGVTSAVVNWAPPDRDRRLTFDQLFLQRAIASGAVGATGPGMPTGGRRPLGPTEAAAMNDRAIAQAEASSGPADTLVLVALLPAPDRPALGFVIVDRPTTGSGSWWAPSTRHAGLMNRNDLAILLHTLIDPTFDTGDIERPRMLSTTFDAEHWRAQDAWSTAQRRLRRPSFDAWCGVLTGVAIAVLAALLLRRRPTDSPWTERFIALARHASLAAAAWPAATMLVVAGAPDPLTKWPWLIATWAVAVAVAELALWIGRSRWTPPALRSPIGLLAALSSVVIGFDVMTGSQLASRNPLGHSFLVGARFYGLGNELFAVFVAALVVVATVLIKPDQSLRRAAGAMVVFTIGLILVTAPRYGADFGGALTIGSTAAVVLVVAVPRRLRVLFAFAAAAGAAVITAVLLLLELRSGSSGQTHIGRFLHAFGSDDPAAESMIERKRLALSRSFRTYAWKYVSAPTVVLIGLALLHRRQERREDRGAEHAVFSLAPAVIGLVAAAVVGSSVNDSGVIVAAIVGTWLAALLLTQPAAQRRPLPADESATPAVDP